MYFRPLRRLEVLEYLVGAGANIEARNLQGATPLHSAASSDKSGSSTALLLYAGARFDVVDVEGWTPLHTAAAFANTVAMQHLLNAGADLHVRDVNGFTPADLAEGALVKLLGP
ncbi:hypothetical protein R5R35_013035 [Gryllus longicercus]|uniref:Ankyrin repeat domain-containing protein 54 n=1 Tax=Gryllus longicercus TaxID=2509291 RepID=A0AAN9Z0Q7_9ORTH